MGSKLSQYDYSILTLKCVNLIQEKTITITIITIITVKMDTLLVSPEGLFYISVY